jgi:hypothetical protein
MVLLGLNMRLGKSFLFLSLGVFVVKKKPRKKRGKEQWLEARDCAREGAKASADVAWLREAWSRIIADGSARQVRALW